MSSSFVSPEKMPRARRAKITIAVLEKPLAVDYTYVEAAGP
jgi:hypothetical protein